MPWNVNKAIVLLSIAALLSLTGVAGWGSDPGWGGSGWGGSGWGGYGQSGYSGNGKCGLSSIKPVCSGGSVTQNTGLDTPDNCKYVTCQGKGGSLQVKACEKPDEVNPTSFEMYKAASSGSGIRICIDDACLSTDSQQGFASAPLTCNGPNHGRYGKHLGRYSSPSFGGHYGPGYGYGNYGGYYGGFYPGYGYTSYSYGYPSYGYGPIYGSFYGGDPYPYGYSQAYGGYAYPGYSTISPGGGVFSY